MADHITEILALLAEQMRSADQDRARADQDRELTIQRFERLTEVMLSGFVRLEDKLDEKFDELKQEVAGVNQRVDHLTDRVDILTDEQRTLNRRLQATFDQTGQLTEQAADTDLRLTRTERQAVPTNAELDARLREVETRLRNAS